MMDILLSEFLPRTLNIFAIASLAYVCVWNITVNEIQFEKDPAVDADYYFLSLNGVDELAS